jgi:hypothetical protein
MLSRNQKRGVKVSKDSGPVHRLRRVIPHLLLLSILATSLALGAGSLTNGHSWGDDFAGYIMQARSIAEGNVTEFLQLNRFTIENSSFSIGPVAYPWGYPLLLAPIYKYAGFDLRAFKLLNVALYCLFLIVYRFLLLKLRLSSSESLLLIACFAFHPGMLGFQNEILSDVLFLLFSTLAILAIQSWFTTDESLPGLASGVTTGLILYAAIFVRTNGLLLVAALLCIQIRILITQNLSRRELLRFAIPHLCVLALGIAGVAIFGGSEFDRVNRMHPGAVKTNLLYYLSLGSEFFSPLPGAGVIYSVMAGIFIIGFIRSPARDLFVKIYFVLTFLFYVFVPYRQGLRYLFPVLPIFLYFSYDGLKSAVSFLSSARSVRLVPAGLLLILSLIFLFNSAQTAARNLQGDRSASGPFDARTLAMYAYIRERTPKDAVVIFFKPRLLRMMTGRDSLMANECNALIKGDYIIQRVDAPVAEQMETQNIDSCGMKLQRVYSDSRFVILRRLNRI